MVAIVLKKRNK